MRKTDYAVTGNGCPQRRGVRQKGAHEPDARASPPPCASRAARIRRASVKTSSDIPKGKIFEAMRLLDNVTLQAPVHMGDVVVHDILGLGVDFCGHEERAVPHISAQDTLQKNSFKSMHRNRPSREAKQLLSGAGFFSCLFYGFCEDCCCLPLFAKAPFLLQKPPFSP